MPRFGPPRTKVRDGKCPYCRIQIKEEKEDDFVPELELVQMDNIISLVYRP